MWLRGGEFTQLRGTVRMLWIADETLGLLLMSLVCGGIFAVAGTITEEKHMPHPSIRYEIDVREIN